MYLFAFLMSWLQSAHSDQLPAAVFSDVPIITEIITETSVGKAKIGMQTTELRKVYQGCTFQPVFVTRYGWYGEGDTPSGIQVAQGKQPLFVYFEDEEKPGKISGLIALHTAYRTTKNIGVGSTSGALRAALPGITIGQDLMDDYDQNLQVASAKGSRSAISYAFAKQKDVGSYSKDFSSPIVVSTARISWITVFPK
ncbi:hypothetical protein SAMN06265337_2623 [Hymenobacter gelipurpurascens]|uniref:Uncharacterized protein n=1 Tax=Hymenobacter gelipurpurascens TaxID=89968 RepID=A0A212U9H6_9BACT|nr:hypothetical protein [Hymenobacter gelipurpurascens]SNC74938.1 hypothetical protein SAMN06265337_2623 [Hymenobacter gelipurpurascens]